MKQFIPENGIYVNFRYNNEKTIMIIANNNQENKELQLGRFAEMLARKTIGTEITNSKTYSLKKPVSIPAKSVLIFEIK